MGSPSLVLRHHDERLLGVPGPPSLGQPVHGVTTRATGGVANFTIAPVLSKNGNDFVGHCPAAYRCAPSTYHCTPLPTIGKMFEKSVVSLSYQTGAKSVPSWRYSS